MENKVISREELNKIPQEILVDMFLQLRDSLMIMQEQNATLIKQVSALQENLAVLTQQRFGRKTEKLSEMPGQLHLTFDTSDAINEAEVLTDNGIPKEPEIETVVVHRRKTKGKRKAELEGIAYLTKSM